MFTNSCLTVCTNYRYTLHQFIVCSKNSTNFEREVYSLSSECIGEGNGTPLQYSCLENPMDGGAWWATVHGVAKRPHD